MARFTNQAQLRYGNEVTNSNIAVGEILEALSAVKTAVRSVYGQRDKVTYSISMVNAGAALTGLTLTDNLGAYAFGTDSLVPLTYIPGTVKYYVNGVLQPTPTVTAGPPMSITGLSIPANGSTVLLYETETNQYTPLTAGSFVTNTAVLSGTGLAPVSVTETIEADTEPLLTITKSVSPVPVTQNGTLTYTFLIQNAGNAAATTATGVVVTDTFDPILENITVTFNGTVLTETTDYTYNKQTGAFIVNAGQITVPAAEFTQDTTGAWMVNPGVSTLVVSGTIQ